MGDEGDDQNVAIGNAIKTKKTKKKVQNCQKNRKNCFFLRFL